MRVAVLAAVALVSAGLLAGCGTRHNSKAVPFIPEWAPPTSSMERNWLAGLGSLPLPLTQPKPIEIRVRANTLTESIRRAVQEPGVHIVSLQVYPTLTLPSPLTPALYLEVSRPAYFVRHRLKAVIPLLTEHRRAYYLRVDGGRIGDRVLEWYWSPHGGAWFIGPGLEGCYPFPFPGPAFARVPPCPSK